MWTAIAETLLKILPDLYKEMSELIRSGKRGKKMDAQLEDLGKLLTGRLVDLLRILDDTGNVDYPATYGRVLFSYVGPGATGSSGGFSPEVAPGWEHAAKYACSYLSALGLVEQFGAGGSEVKISEIGKTLVRTDKIREYFRPSFSQSLPDKG